MNNYTKFLKTILKTQIVTIISVVFLSGCIEILYDSARLTKKKAEIQTWLFLANDGDVEAQYKVGSLYCCGERPYYNNVEALKWWCSAAKAGQRDAQFEIGRMYEDNTDYKGSPVPVDMVLAYVYYSIALNNHHKEVPEYLKRIEKKLSDDEKKEAETLIKRFPRIWCENPR